MHSCTRCLLLQVLDAAALSKAALRQYMQEYLQRGKFGTISRKLLLTFTVKQKQTRAVAGNRGKCTRQSRAQEQFLRKLGLSFPPYYGESPLCFDTFKEKNKSCSLAGILKCFGGDHCESGAEPTCMSEVRSIYGQPDFIAVDSISDVCGAAPSAGQKTFGDWVASQKHRQQQYVNLCAPGGKVILAMDKEWHIHSAAKGFERQGRAEKSNQKKSSASRAEIMGFPAPNKAAGQEVLGSAY